MKLSGKRTVTGQNSGELYTKKHRRGNSKSLGKPTQSLFTELFPNYIEVVKPDPKRFFVREAIDDLILKYREKLPKNLIKHIKGA